MTGQSSPRTLSTPKEIALSLLIVILGSYSLIAIGAIALSIMVF
jgi:hypothetical protein